MTVRGGRVAGGGVHLGVRINARTSGGGRVFATQLVEALGRSPHCASATVFVLGDHLELDLPGGVDVVQVEVPSSKGSSRLGPGRALHRRVRGEAALRSAAGGRPLDALVCPGTELSRLDGVRSILWPLTVAPFEPQTRSVLGGSPAERLRWRTLRQLVRRACLRADGLVFSSHYARAVHEAAAPALRCTPSTVIWPAPSLPAGAAAPPGTRSYDLHRPYILTVSHVYPYKMMVELVDGFARLVERTGARHDLVIAGALLDDGYARRVRAAVAEHRLDDRVHLLGDVSPADLPALYAGAESFAFLSLSENASSYALIDALAHGKPIVSSCLSSMPEMVQDAARYVDPRDPDHIAEGLSAVCRDGDLRQELSARALARAAELPAWDDIATELVHFIGRLVDTGARRTPDLATQAVS